jgi:hypothetical protein
MSSASFGKYRKQPSLMLNTPRACRMLNLFSFAVSLPIFVRKDGRTTFLRGLLVRPRPVTERSRTFFSDGRFFLFQFFSQAIIEASMPPTDRHL